MGKAMDSRIRIMLITTTISMSVNPRWPRLDLRSIPRFAPFLPVFVLRVVESRVLRLGVHIEDVLLAPGIGIRIVLHGTHPPLRLSSHGIDGNLAEELELFALDVDSFHQGFEIWRI